MVENVTFNLIRKNGKPYIRMTAYGQTTDMKVWKVNSDTPYVKYSGMVAYLDEEMKKALVSEEV